LCGFGWVFRGFSGLCCRFSLLALADTMIGVLGGKTHRWICTLLEKSNSTVID